MPNTKVHHSIQHILQFFDYKHLPSWAAAVSAPFCELADSLVHGRVGLLEPLPQNPELTVAQRFVLWLLRATKSKTKTSAHVTT